jgi:hypothetical protein
VGVGENLAGGAYVTGLFVAATGSAAAAIDVVALESQTAADVRTGHIANDAASEETNRSSQERTRSRTKRHIVHALSGAGRGRRKHGRHDDGHRKYLFHDESLSRCTRCGSCSSSSRPKATAARRWSRVSRRCSG